MKKVLFVFLFLWFGCIQINLAQESTEKLLMQEYLKQSEKQKKTGLIMLGTGIGASLLGTVMIGAAWGDSDSNFLGGTGVVLLTAGTISTLVSIPIIASSASKGKKAGKLSLTLVRGPQAFLPIPISGAFPAVSFSLPLTPNR